MVKFLDNPIEPTISVVLPAYNCEKYISDAIKSILAQTFSDFELIIINDGSTDNSLNLIESFMDPRIKIINHKSNKGLVSSLNEGISISRGHFIARMDADDISAPDRFAKQLSIFEDESVGMVCTNTISIDEKGNKISTPWWEVSDKVVTDDLLWTNPIVHPSTIIRHSHIQKYHNIAGAEDYELWTRISQKTKIVRVGQVLLYHRIHEHSVMGKLKDESEQNSIKINQGFIEKIFGLEVPNFHQNLTTFISYGHVKKLYPLSLYKKWLTQLSMSKLRVKIPVSRLLWHYFIKLTRLQKIKALCLFK